MIILDYAFDEKQILKKFGGEVIKFRKYLALCWISWKTC